MASWALQRGTMRVAPVMVTPGSDPRRVEGELFGKGQEEVAALLRTGLSIAEL